MSMCLGRSLAHFPRLIELNNQAARAAATTASTSSKQSGDISSVFPSLSGAASPSLAPRFADLKKRLIRDHEVQVQDSWRRLLGVLHREGEEIKTLGSAVVPEINFYHLSDVGKRTGFRDALHKRGVAVIRGVVPEKEALDWKELLQRYIRSNPSTKGFPPTNPAVYELYWSPSQILARAHPNILKAQRFLMSHWRAAPSSTASNKSSTTPLVSTSHPVTYADRLRIRQPGDSGFALGPHIDGGSCERWEEDGYGLGGVYSRIFAGEWENYDPWEMTCRTPVKSDLYNSPGGSIHAVDKVHTGTSDSSVMYVPACPLTEANAEYLARQRETFAEGTPAPDFPSGEGESHHRGRLTPEYVMKNISLEAQQAMGLAPWDPEQKGIPERERGVLRKANEILGFAKT
ncbi:MAG: hypothetical protein Q9216_003356 [Gyalolechia sp. 2 TL-2023]